MEMQSEMGGSENWRFDALGKCEKVKLEMVLTGSTVLNLSELFIRGKSRACSLAFLHFKYDADRL